MAEGLRIVPVTKKPLRIILPDQLGPNFVDDEKQKTLLIVPMKDTFARKMHIQKAVWWMSAILHRVAEAKEPIELIFCEDLAGFLKGFSEEAEVIGPTSFEMRKAFISKRNIVRLPSRGFVTSEYDFANWISSRAGKRLKLEDFYRFARVKHNILLNSDGSPVGGAWNFDNENRLPPPKSDQLPVKHFEGFTWNEIDEEALSKIKEFQSKGFSFIGSFKKEKYFASSRSESLVALKNFIDHRLELFGPYEDASLQNDWIMAHSLLSAPMNIGLLDPNEVIAAATRALHDGVPINSVEGFVRQILGWRDYVWHLYWHFGENYVSESNHFAASKELPDWMADLTTNELTANCLKVVTQDLQERGWLHHIQRLMILGNWALQQQLDPKQLVDWFDRAFLDGHPWVMAANVVGMSQYADGGRMSTKPYVSGGAYINKMSNFCKSCTYSPEVRVGKQACPFTAGYWKFIHRNQDEFKKNPRISQAVYGLARLKDLSVLLQEKSNEK
ncbi:MAG: cryptochrome/photolyase family protein [Candidatus Nanopelagicales bacterium]